MFKLFSEIFRHGLVYLASLFMKIAGTNVDYIDCYKTGDSDVFVKYYLGNHQFEEPYLDFLQSNYARFLDTKQLSKLLNDVAEAKSRHKIFEIEQDEENPELFKVINTQTGISQTCLLSRIINDRNMLENMSAETLKQLIESVVKLANCGITPSMKEDGNNDISPRKKGFRILRSKNKNNDRD